MKHTKKNLIKTKDFNEKPMELLNRIKAQGAHSFGYRTPLSKIIQRHEKGFANFGKLCDKILCKLYI